MIKDRYGDVNRRYGIWHTDFSLSPGMYPTIYGKPGGRYWFPICRYNTNPWDGTGEVESVRHFRNWENPAPWGMDNPGY